MERADLGRLIKEARLSKKMTQSEVVGTFITRNMLSQIESGVAIPSLKTLEYLSKKLDISIQMLTPENRAEKEEQLIAPSSQDEFLPIKISKNAYRFGDYKKAADVLKPYLKEDSQFFDEYSAIYTMSCLAYSKSSDVAKNEALFYAKEALNYSEKGFYSCREWKVEAFCIVDELSH